MDEDRLLAACYGRSLEVARTAGARTIAFPAISTGVYRFPPERAVGIAAANVARQPIRLRSHRALLLFKRLRRSASAGTRALG